MVAHLFLAVKKIPLTKPSTALALLLVVRYTVRMYLFRRAAVSRQQDHPCGGPRRAKKSPACRRGVVVRNRNESGV